MSRFSNLFQEPTPDPETLDGYIEDARDGDNDGIVQEGTPFERPASTPKSSKKKPTLG
jgi:hypothetical protein